MSVQAVLGERRGIVLSLRPGDTVRDATAKLAQQHIGLLVVLDSDDALIGVISERDIIASLGEKGESAFDQPVSSIMTPNPATCAVTDDAYEAIEKMNAHRCRHLPVVEAGQVIGVLSVRELMDHVWQTTTERERRALIARIALA